MFWISRSESKTQRHSLEIVERCIGKAEPFRTGCGKAAKTLVIA